ncbi:MFS transporter [Haloplanus litoreus]|uniref:MFS transporter n=1 Tax=Haloplanus litoreus TaxID=767515 RepID=UPI00360E793E
MPRTSAPRTESWRSPGTALWVLVASGTLTVMAGAVLGPVVNRIGTSLGVSQSRAGLVVTTHGLFIVLTSPLAGGLIDRYGPRRPYVLGLALYGIAGAAGLIVETFPALLVSRAALGVAVAFVYTSITVLIYNLYEGSGRIGRWGSGERQQPRCGGLAARRRRAGYPLVARAVRRLPPRTPARSARPPDRPGTGHRTR